MRSLHFWLKTPRCCLGTFLPPVMVVFFIIRRNANTEEYLLLEKQMFLSDSSFTRKLDILTRSQLTRFLNLPSPPLPFYKWTFTRVKILRSGRRKRKDWHQQHLRKEERWGSQYWESLTCYKSELGLRATAAVTTTKPLTTYCPLKILHL